MKRPLACIGLGVLAALAAAAAFSDAAVYMAAVCAVISAALFALRVFLSRKTIPAAAVMLSAALALTYYSLSAQLYKVPAEELDGQRVTFSGIIVSQMYTSGKTTSFTVRTDTINGEPRSINVTVRIAAFPDGGLYDRFTARAVINRIDKNGYGLDYSTHCAAEHIFAETYIGSYDDTLYAVNKNCGAAMMQNIGRKLLSVRRHISKTLESRLPFDEAKLCTAMVTGQRQELPENIRMQFSTLGTAHIIVVSGLHLSVLAAMLSLIADGLFRSRYLSCIFQLGGVFTFAALVGFGFSIRRALVIFAVMILSRSTHSKPDPLNSIGLAALVICADPFSGGDIGLLWSFSSSIGIVLFADRIKALFVKNNGKASMTLNLAAVSAAAYIGSLPIVLLYTKNISPYTLFANLLEVPVTGVIIFCAFAAAILSPIGADAVFTLITGAAAKYLLFVSKLLCSLPFARQYTGAAVISWWIIIAAAAAFTVCVIFGKRHLFKLCAVVSLTALGLIVSANAILFGSDVYLTVDDSGGGLTAVLEYDEQCAVLCAYGDRDLYYPLDEELEKYGIIAFVSDVRPKGSASLCGRILREHEVSCVITSYSENPKYSWYRYCGGDVRMMEREYTLGFKDGYLLIYEDGERFCEYLVINGKEVLICPKGEIPENMRCPDIAVIGEDTDSSLISGALIVTGCFETADEAQHTGKTEIRIGS